MVLGAELAPVGRVGAGQLAAMLGPHRTTIDHDVPRHGLGPGAHHADQDGVDPTQQGDSVPGFQATAQGGATSAPGAGPQLPPLHALTKKVPERLDNPEGRHERPSGGERPLLEAVDDRRHQVHRSRRHARLPCPKAWETDAWPVGPSPTDGPIGVLKTGP